MITETRNGGPNLPSAAGLPVPAERAVFLDIETTGLKPGGAMLYLAGVLYYTEENWKLLQFFAEKRQEEPEILKRLSCFFEERVSACGRLLLVSYNGDAFDLPWIRVLEKAYGLKVLPPAAESLDLYRALRPYRKLAGLSDCRLPSAARLCGYARTDETNGGELISVYEDWLDAAVRESGGKLSFRGRELTSQEVPPLLLAHNADDLKALPCILPVLSYRALFAGDFVPEAVSEICSPEDFPGTESAQTADVSEAKSSRTAGVSGMPFSKATGGSEMPFSKAAGGSGTPGSQWDGCAETGQAGRKAEAPEQASELEFRYRLRCALPAGFSCRSDGYRISVSSEEPDLLRIRARLFTGELKRFYPDWKEYYYLPSEDTAVHRSLGVFVDRRNRVPASPRSCYTRTSGTFLPLPPALPPEALSSLTVFNDRYQGEKWILPEAVRAQEPLLLTELGLAALRLLPVGTDPGQIQNGDSVKFL